VTAQATAQSLAEQLVADLDTPVLEHLTPFQITELGYAITTNTGSADDNELFRCLSTGERAVLLLAAHLEAIGELVHKPDQVWQGRVSVALATLAGAVQS